MKRIIDGCHAVALGVVNAFLLDTPEGLVLVDTGFPGRERDILAAMKQAGHEPRALKHIVLTHAHRDHVGSAAALVRATGAATWMHREDAPVAENRTPMRPIHPFSGVLSKVVFAAIARMGAPTWDSVTIDNQVADGDVLPFGSLRVIHAPGHCAGQIALLWPERNLLIAADTCVHVVSLRSPVIGENDALARHSLARLAREQFETAVFGHGRAIVSGADRQFRKAFAAT